MDVHSACRRSLSLSRCYCFLPLSNFSNKAGPLEQTFVILAAMLPEHRSSRSSRLLSSVMLSSIECRVIRALLLVGLKQYKRHNRGYQNACSADPGDGRQRNSFDGDPSDTRACRHG